MARFVIYARRTLAFCYVTRYYKRGRNKQYFMDFVLEALERDLEKATEEQERRWFTLLEDDSVGQDSIGLRFQLYQQQLHSLRELLEKHFNAHLKAIQDGLPEVDEDSGQGQSVIVFEMEQWTCWMCKLKHPKSLLQCTNCYATKIFEDTWQ
jgi:hypothetical protein